VGIDPKLSDAELVTLAVMQVYLRDPVAAVRTRSPAAPVSLPAAAAWLQRAPAPVRDGRGRRGPPGRGFLPFLCGQGPRGEPDAIGVVSPV